MLLRSLLVKLGIIQMAFRKKFCILFKIFLFEHFSQLFTRFLTQFRSIIELCILLNTYIIDATSFI